MDGALRSAESAWAQLVRGQARLQISFRRDFKDLEGLVLRVFRDFKFLRFAYRVYAVRQGGCFVNDLGALSLRSFVCDESTDVSLYS